MSQVHDSPAATDLVAQGRLAFADAALSAAGHEVSDPALRQVLAAAARHELTGDEAVAAIRRHVAG